VPSRAKIEKDPSKEQLLERHLVKVKDIVGGGREDERHSKKKKCDSLLMVSPKSSSRVSLSFWGVSGHHPVGRSSSAVEYFSPIGNPLRGQGVHNLPMD